MSDLPAADSSPEPAAPDPIPADAIVERVETAPTEAPADPQVSSAPPAEAPPSMDGGGTPPPMIAAEPSHAEPEPEATTEDAAALESPAVEAPASETPASEPSDEPQPAAAHGRGSRAKAAGEARGKALERLHARYSKATREEVEWIVDALDAGSDPVFLGRFRREKTAGMDERLLREVRDFWQEVRAVEERRVELLALLASRGALSEALANRLAHAHDVPAMEDLAAPWLPVTATRATLARGHGIQPLADAIRSATAEAPTPLADLAKPHVKEGSEVPTLDVALGGARDILAEEICLDADLRGRLRALFRREGQFSVGLRTEKKGDAGRHGSLVNFKSPTGRVPPLKLLAVRRGEKERILTSTIEPPEEKALAIVHDAVGGTASIHPHAGFLRAAAEDGYRRILKPMLQAEIRGEMKARADEAAFETFERSLRNLLLGPIGGAKKTLGLLPDVTGGHRAGAVDELGRTVYTGRLPHEATAGAEAAVAALKGLLDSHGIEAIVIGSGGGRREAGLLVKAALEGYPRPVDVSEAHDGGTRALETQARARPATTESGAEIPPEFLGALSLARRFQDPLSEYARLDPKALSLGPHVHDVHQGRLKTLLEDTITSCVGHVGPDAATADADLLQFVPGFDRAKAKAFVAWRSAGNVLTSKAQLAAVEGVGPAAAEQAVGFLRVSTAPDPRDRTQLHPEQFGLLDEMATQVGIDVPGLFREPRARARVDLSRIARAEAPMPVLKYALYQATAGLADPRPRFAVPVKPPADIDLTAMRPGLMLEGRVTRAVPFGVFVDVGFDAEALVPIAHIGDRPGIDPATLAPVGAVVHGRVIEIDVPRRRVTLSMRSDRPEAPRERDLRGRPDRSIGRPPQREREPVPAGAPFDRGSGMGSGGGGGPERDGARRPFGSDAPPRRPDGDRRPPMGRDGSRGQGQGEGLKPARPPTNAMVRPPRPTAGAGAGRDGGRRFDRDDHSAPRRISLPADGPAASEAAAASESAEAGLTPEQLLAKKLEELKRRIARPE